MQAVLGGVEGRLHSELVVVGGVVGKVAAGHSSELAPAASVVVVVAAAAAGLVVAEAEVAGLKVESSAFG